jgi:hypothetical protein
MRFVYVTIYLWYVVVTTIPPSHIDKLRASLYPLHSYTYRQISVLEQLSFTDVISKNCKPYWDSPNYGKGQPLAVSLCHILI